MLVQRWSTENGGPTLKQHWFNVLCPLGYYWVMRSVGKVLFLVCGNSNILIPIVGVYYIPKTHQLVLFNPLTAKLFNLNFYPLEVEWKLFRFDIMEVNSFQILLGRGPRVVVSTAAFHARVRGSVPGLGGLKETKNVSSPSTCESQYCGEPPWPRGSVLGLRPPGGQCHLNYLTILRRFSWPSLAYMCTKVA